MKRIDPSPMRGARSTRSALAAAMASGLTIALMAQSCGIMSKDECAERATCLGSDGSSEFDSPTAPTSDAAADTGQGGEDVATSDRGRQSDDGSGPDGSEGMSDAVAADSVGVDSTGGDSASADSASGDAASEDATSEPAVAPDAVSVDASDDGPGGDGGACAAGLLDKITACTAASPACAKGCGPKTASGNLGTKGCSCNLSTMVYNCQNCMYPTALPACYQPAATPPACTSGVADGVACATPCGGVCTLVVDGGKTDGCVCVQSTSPTWSCATQWW